MKIFNIFSAGRAFFESFFASLYGFESEARQIPLRKPSVPDIESGYDYCIGMPARFGACQIPRRKPSVPNARQD